MPFETHEELVDLAEAFLPRIPPEEFPYFVEHAEQHLLPPDPDEKPEFEFGLDLILDGLSGCATKPEASGGTGRGWLRDELAREAIEHRPDLVVLLGLPAVEELREALAGAPRARRP